MTPPFVDPAAVTPREIVALALGTILGAILNSRREPFRRACCVEKTRQLKEYPRLRTMPDGAEKCPDCNEPRNGGLIGVHECPPRRDPEPPYYAPC